MSEQSADTLGSGDQGGGHAPAVADPEPLKTTRLQPGFHRTGAFRSHRSPRVEGFFEREMPRFLKSNYCKVLILADPDDATKIWGYYTLSPYKLEPTELSNRQRREFQGSISIPMMLIGFIGRDDSAPKRLGEALLVDAARRVARSEDTAGAALILDSDGGPGTRLYAWYRDTMKFEPIRKGGAETGALYCPLGRLLPGEFPP
jgi:hypothetical protein